MKYNKLVRDKVIEYLKEIDKNPVYHKADEKEYWGKLKEKLQEEVKEYLENPTKEELADILEIVYALCKYQKINKKELENIRKSKSKIKGKFLERIILDEAEE